MTYQKPKRHCEGAEFAYGGKQSHRSGLRLGALALFGLAMTRSVTFEF